MRLDYENCLIIHTILPLGSDFLLVLCTSTFRMSLVIRRVRCPIRNIVDERADDLGIPRHIKLLIKNLFNYISIYFSVDFIK